MALTKEDLNDALEPIKTDLHLVKEGLFNPDKGLYARVERNTVWRKIHMWVYTAIALGFIVAVTATII